MIGPGHDRGARARAACPEELTAVAEGCPATAGAVIEGTVRRVCDELARLIVTNPA